VKRLVHYRNGITMADTLGGSYIAVKPHLQEEARPWRITTSVAQCRGHEKETVLRAGCG